MTGLWLKKNDIYEPVRAEVETAGRDFRKDLNDLYVSPVIAKALMKAARRFIDELERESLDAGETTEQFYRGLREVVVELRDRLNCATDELDKDVASEIVGLPR